MRPRLPRLYHPESAAHTELTLSESQSRHIVKVLRMKTGEKLEIFDGNGRAYDATIADNHKQRTRIHLTAARPPSPADGGKKIHIGQLICAPAKMDWAIEKMTELGVTAITPLHAAERNATARANVPRWHRLAIAACEQCGRNRLPILNSPIAATDWHPDEHRIILTPRARHSLPKLASAIPPPIALAIGNESGFDTKTESQLIAAGFQPAHLGHRILRTETAGLAALAVLLIAD